MSTTAKIGSELVRYDNTALAAGAVHMDMVKTGREQLKQIRNKLPIGAEAVVKILVTADGADSKIFHAANVHMANMGTKDFRVSVNMGRYVKGHYVDNVRALEQTQHSSEIVSSMSNSSNEVVVYRHPLIYQNHVVALSTMDVKNKCPNALFIVSAVGEIFKSGVPLPVDERVHCCFFQVMVQLPNQQLIEHIGLNYGVRGTHDHRAVSAPWICTTVQDNDSESLKKQFQQYVEEANGKSEISGIPATASKSLKDSPKLLLE